MTFRDLVATALAAPPIDGVMARARLFDELGWRVERRGPSSASSLSLLAGGAPRVLVTGDAPPARAVSLGYSNEAPLTLSWGSEALRLSRTRVWHRFPGDTAIATVSAEDDVATLQLLDALARERIAGLFEAPQEGEPHRQLAVELASAFAGLRLQAKESDLGADGERDVFQLFHQLLFVRFHEDRFGPVGGAGTLSAALDMESPTDHISELLRSYTSRFNSELFGTHVELSRMPRPAVLDVIRAMVEPWDRLLLDFSVTSRDVAGRLYQSFLASTPALEREGHLFPVAIRIDRQRERGAFYTPQPLAELLAERCLGTILSEKRPTVPADVRVLDPACGSGAFLLAAYRVLIRYFEALSGDPADERLRLEILTDSLYGGDDDDTAIALTRIQLLEEASVDKRRLPSLAENIKYTDLLGIKADGAPAAWREVLNNGGFDAILSNPPFHGPTRARQAGFDMAALQNRFSSARGTGWNIASAFLEAGLELLAGRGKLTMLVPQPILDGPSGASLRITVGHGRVAEVIDFGRNELFSPTLAYVAAVSVRGSEGIGPASLTGVTASKVAVADLIEAMAPLKPYSGGTPFASPTFTIVAPEQSLASADSWSPFAVRWRDFADRSLAAEFQWIGEPGTPQVAIGTQTGADTRFVLEGSRWAVDGDSVIVDNRYSVPSMFVPLWVSGADIRPFSVGSLSQRVVVPELGEVPAVDRLIAHLGGVPASFRAGNLSALRGPKVIVRGLFDEPAAVADSTGDWMIPQGGAGAFAVVPSRKSDVFLFEALLNSALYQWLLQGLGHSKTGGYVQIMRHHWRHVPWPRLGPVERKQVTAAAQLVKRALRITGPTRPSRYWDARLQLDAEVYDSLGAAQSLRDIVSSELWRRP